MPNAAPNRLARDAAVWLAIVALIATVAVVVVGRFADRRRMSLVAIATPAAPVLPQSDGMVQLPGGSFAMGYDGASVDAQPAHRVRLDPFWIDQREVTNAQFARFVDATTYRTIAQRRGWSEVFDPRSGQWGRVDGADWRHPEGPETTIVGRDALPVVHVAWDDAAAYAAWAGKRLPTEAEWEYAARATLHGADYPWGRQLAPSDQPLANFWQGAFPDHDERLDGYHGAAPVGAFPSNRFGLFDVAGNVAEWCADWYAADTYQVSAPHDPAGPERGLGRVVRGGSWLSTGEDGGELCVWARQFRSPTSTNNFTGFRCARDL